MGQLDFLIIPLVVIVIVQGWKLTEITDSLDVIKKQLDLIRENLKHDNK